MVYLDVAEKRRPHFNLAAIRLAFSRGKGLYTRTALIGAAALGCGRREIDGIIGTILPGHFYKSMTSKHNTRVWQDVYHPTHNGTKLYIKFTDNGCVAEFTLLSFKEK
jgi:motility quorum-sensing regulator / GCU-specific mRNA interferase toxin